MHKAITIDSLTQVGATVTGQRGQNKFLLSYYSYSTKLRIRVKIAKDTSYDHQTIAYVEAFRHETKDWGHVANLHWLETQGVDDLAVLEKALLDRTLWTLALS